MMAATNGIESRRLGGSGIEVSAIGLGCMSLSGVYGASEDNTGAELIRGALDRGIPSLDTSDMYGWANKEELVGRAIAGRRAGIVLATKFGQVQRPGGANG